MPKLKMVLSLFYRLLQNSTNDKGMLNLIEVGTLRSKRRLFRAILRSISWIETRSTGRVYVGLNDSGQIGSGINKRSLTKLEQVILLPKPN